MSDQSEIFRLLRDHRRGEREEMHVIRLAILRLQGLTMTLRNDGHHVILYTRPRIDFWPSTGKWISGNWSRQGKRHGVGVVSLLRFLRDEASQAKTADETQTPRTA